jgi:hypothetical protein
MPKLEDVLKSKGYTDADLSNISTLLSDSRFRSSLEASFEETAQQARDARDAEWESIKTSQWQPIIEKSEKDAMEARREAARLREENAIAKDYGYLGGDEAKQRLEAQERERHNREEQERGNRGGFNPNDPAVQDFSGKFAVAQGRAMAMYTDISNAHQRLFGEPLESFEALYNDFLALPATARQTTSMRDLWERKYNVPAKRAEIDARRQSDHDAAVSKQAVEKYIMDNPQLHSQPMMQGPRLSNSPFLPKPSEAAKQPWEKTAQERRSARVERATQNELKLRIQ